MTDRLLRQIVVLLMIQNFAICGWLIIWALR